MNGRNFEDVLRDRMRRAIAPELPGDGASDAILRAVRHRATADGVRRPAMRRAAAFAGAGLLLLVFAGLLSLAFVVRRQASPVPPAPARSLPVVSAPVVPVCPQATSGTGCATGPSAAPTPSPTASPTPSKGPSTLLDLTWISDQDGWALGRTGCGAAFCAQVFNTNDGGTTWRQLPDPPAAAAAPPGQGGVQSTLPSVSHIRFAGATVGYLWGPALLMTTDGGQTWQAQQSPTVEALEPSAGSVYRVEYDHGGCPGPCNRTVSASAAGSSTWHAVYAVPGPPSRGARATLAVVGGQTVYVSVFGDLAAGAGTQEAVIDRSLDGGATWKTLSDPCLRGSSAGTTNIAVDVAAAPGGFVAALCSPRTVAQSTQSVVTSGDSGSSWGPLHAMPGTQLQIIAGADSTHIAVATGPLGGSGPTTYQLWSSSDGGVHWIEAVSDRETLAQSDPGTAYLGFESASTGRWSQTGNAIWTTTDGGVHWIRRGFPG
jgi:photosystem II stability/assembly factor-like uncharacterized protein